MVAHAGQTRMDGVTPYFHHPLAVSKMVPDYCQPAALLHDVLEDCPNVYYPMLVELGVEEKTLDAVLTLTKYSAQGYADYMARINENEIARIVKIADMEHNLSDNPKPETAEKYKKALAYLKTVRAQAEWAKQNPFPKGRYNAL